MIKQGSQFIADCPMRIGSMQVNAGDLFWVTTPAHTNIDAVKICRAGRGAIGTGKLIAVSDLLTHFKEA